MKDIQDCIYFFNAPWCGPCKVVKKYLSKEIIEELNIINVDISENIDLAREYFVASVPTFVKVIKGKKEKMHVGKLSLEELKTF